MRTVQIALDGPSGSGKSTMARRISRELGFYYIDTGALYRAVGLFVKRSGIDPTDEEAVARALEACKVSFDFVDGVQRTMLCGEDVSQEIRVPEISQIASQASALPCVRALLLDVQRTFARGQQYYYGRTRYRNDDIAGRACKDFFDRLCGGPGHAEISGVNGAR